MAYKIDPIKDWPLVDEFRRNPIGHHSPSLMRVLNTLRYDPSGYQTIIIARVQFEEWVLATMPPERERPLVIHENRVFTSREEAEWTVFCGRWQAHTGQSITTPRHLALPDQPPC